jgi:hypothetical protein
MPRWFAIDTGSTRNASALVGAEECARVWTLFLARKWQGTQEEPLDHRNVVGPEMADLIRSAGGTTAMGDAVEKGPIKLAWRGRIQFEEQGGTLDKVYKHAQTVIHERRLRVAIKTPIAGLTVDVELWEEIKRGLAAVQEERRPEGPKVYLPSDGKSHHDLASAFLRMMAFAKAGDEPGGGQSSLANLNRTAPAWLVDGELDELVLDI